MSIHVLRSRALTLLATVAIGSPVAAQQLTLPPRPHDTLNVLLESFRDDVTLYLGDPQQMLLMDTRPARFRPRVDYITQSDAIMRIRDLYVFDHDDYASLTPAQKDESGDTPVAEKWDVRLTPGSPVEFSIRLERGKSELDFSDLEVRSVSLRGDESEIMVEFSSQNPIPCDRFAARIVAGSLGFKGMLNARAKEISLDVDQSKVRFDLTGRGFEGESAITVLGVPSDLRMKVSRKVGLRVTGSPATLAKFAGGKLSQAGDDLQSQGYEEATCRVHLTFGSDVPKLAVGWD